MKEQNLQYIINLATQVSGVNADFRETFAKYEAGIEPYDREKGIRELSVILSHTVTKKVREMNPETLGRICAYGLYPGGLAAWADCSTFIRKTGIKDVHPNSFSVEKSGRDLIVEIAISIIVATVYDILHQDEYQENAKCEQDLDEQLDRAEHDYVHYVHGQH